MGTKIITQPELPERKSLSPVINQSATKRDVQSFLNKNNTVAKFTLDFYLLLLITENGETEK